MSKALRKAIMHRSKFKNIYNKYRTEENWANYKKRRNFCVHLLRKTKTEYLQKLKVKDLSDYKKFWETIKPFFSNKGLNSNKLMLKENNGLTIMNIFSVNITTKGLDLKKDYDSSLSPVDSENINDILEKHKHHSNVHKISQTFMTNEKFSFQFVTEDHRPLITNSIKLSIEKGYFPEELRLAEVSPIFKKKDDLDKENYRPVSVSPHVSKVFVKIMYHQIKDYTRQIIETINRI